jgi:hypothetical protein
LYSNRYSNLGESSRFAHEKQANIASLKCIHITFEEFSQYAQFEFGVPQITYDFIKFITGDQIDMREVSKALMAEAQHNRSNSPLKHKPLAQ